ncbi:uncharacterized protein LOC117342152 [Pecten maximus]|uniref:uncharacterized protein LOC117342152 n=1 Tax=Pecten maximus TaxID=6579 RepID=UPI001458A8C9|nr:uncharacterized protein LOC117342152 [Pecten maximus]
MYSRETFFLLTFLILLYANSSGHAQLIGKEKDNVFFEQAVLERLKSAVMGMSKDLEIRVGRLEEENERISLELNLKTRRKSNILPTTRIDFKDEERLDTSFTLVKLDTQNYSDGELSEFLRLVVKPLMMYR